MGSPRLLKRRGPLERRALLVTNLRAGALALAVAIAIAAIGAVWELRPFTAPVHSWLVVVAVALGGAFLLNAALVTMRSASAHERFAALGAFGGALLAGAIVHASFLVGAPQRVPAAPGQTYSPAGVGGVAVVFPAVAAGGSDRSPIRWPDSVLVRARDGDAVLADGEVRRSGPYVFRALRGPIAFVAAKKPDGRSVTVTQPNGSAFASPYLTFPSIEGGRPTDLFAVPALHRYVTLAYYAGLPEHGIDVPFLLLQINEENGGKLYQGVALDGRQLDEAGVRLDFRLGTYPVVLLSSAPAPIPFACGVVMVAAGLAGYALFSVLKT